MGAMKQLGLFVCLLISMVTAGAAQPEVPISGPWDQPAAALAEQIAGILGPGQAQLMVRNASSLSQSDVAAVRKLLEQDLKSHGVQLSGAESASTIRVTLSENRSERLWVAEVIEGGETHVAMVSAEPAMRQAVVGNGSMTLRKQVLIQAKTPILAVLETRGGLIAIEPEEIVILDRTNDRWQEAGHFPIAQKRALPRDPRAILWPAANGNGFDANVAGASCTGSYDASVSPEKWSILCHESDDPWMVAREPAAQAQAAADAASGSEAIKAFYNATRDYFTGVVTPGIGVDLPPFYAAGLLPRASGGALLISGIDGKVQLAENNSLKPVSGTRDWGSDFAVLHSGCGVGDQVIASGSGEAESDSLRAYDLPGLEAIPASMPLTMDGTVTALWSGPDGTSVLTTVRRADGDYEVDRVAALCN